VKLGCQALSRLVNKRSRFGSLQYRNRGDGTFEDVSERAGITAKKQRALGVPFADYDGDGFTDIFVSNDGMQQFLFRNNGDGTFTECALESGAGLTADRKGLSGGITMAVPTSSLPFFREKTTPCFTTTGADSSATRVSKAGWAR